MLGVPFIGARACLGCREDCSEYGADTLEITVIGAYLLESTVTCSCDVSLILMMILDGWWTLGQISDKIFCGTS